MLGSRPFASLVFASFLMIASAPTSTAQDVGGLSRQLSSATDFRVRVGAALSLGKIHGPQSGRALRGALDDPHPAVRAAAAAALGASGDGSAVEALRAHLSSETSMAVKSQIEAAIARLEQSPSARGGESARVLVKLGAMRNLSGVGGGRLAEIFRGATTRRMASVPGIELVADGSDYERLASARRLPAIVLDGSVNRLAKAAKGSEVMIDAQVEYVIRKLPDHSLKGSVSGAAQAIASASAVADGAHLAQLENDALSGAVESAFRSAPTAFAQALR